MKTFNVLFVLLLSFSASLCNSKCPAGRTLTQVVKPTSNGCGPSTGDAFGDMLNKLGKAFLEKFQTCCDSHDMCYGTCVSIKDKCESDFITCMTEKCDEIKNLLNRSWCKTKAKSTHSLVFNHGLKYFNNAQDTMCKCL